MTTTANPTARLTVRGGTIFLDGHRRGSYDLREGTARFDGRPLDLVHPANMGIRTVGVTSSMVIGAVRAAVDRIYEWAR